MTIEESLASLRDVKGVLGSFIIDEEGHVTHRDLPMLFDDEALAAAAPRVARLREALEVDGHELENCVLHLGSQLLLMRSAGPEVLCVIAPVDVDQAILRMGANLVARRLVRGVSTAGGIPAPAPQPLPDTVRPPARRGTRPPGSPPGAGPAPSRGEGRPRWFRGRKIE